MLLILMTNAGLARIAGSPVWTRPVSGWTGGGGAVVVVDDVLVVVVSRRVVGLASACSPALRHAATTGVASRPATNFLRDTADKWDSPVVTALEARRCARRAAGGWRTGGSCG